MHPYIWQQVDLAVDLSWHPLEDPAEPLGSKEKQWMQHATNPDDRWLLKLSRPGSGEWWAECLVHPLACLIGVPSACVLPAITESGRAAMLSRSVLRDGERLEHGKDILSRALGSRYDASIGDNNPEYTVSNIFACLNDAVDRSTSPAGLTAVETMAGYLMLDAWVSATDRHHDNWAVATHTSGSRRLAESYDHGSALGFSLSQDDVSGFGEVAAVRHWAGKGRSHYYGKPSMAAVAAEALSLVGIEARQYWLARLDAATDWRANEVLTCVPEAILSPERRRFILNLLNINREMIHECLACAKCA
ncbi:MAG: hypothetical protein LBV30_00385 [Propionibacteriaceae bacterium]|jgi:hypothetical protein|nr:hypothetical protein [Propionibacteriaceae bacterium]